MNINWDHVGSLVRELVQRRVADQVGVSTVLLDIIRHVDVDLFGDDNIGPAREISQTQAGGEQVYIPLRYKLPTSSVQNYSGFQPINIPTEKLFTRAAEGFANYIIPIPIPEEEIDIHFTSEISVVNYISTLISAYEQALEEVVSQDLYTGTGGMKIWGLDSLIHASNTMHGIDASTYAYWQSYVDSTSHSKANMLLSGNASFLPDLWATGFAACSNNGNRPNLILTSQETWDVYEKICQAYQTFNRATTMRTKKIADMGYAVLEWRGIPVVVDPVINTTNYPMYMLSTRSFHHIHHPRANMSFGGFNEALDQVGRVGKIRYRCASMLDERRAFARWTTTTQ